MPSLAVIVAVIDEGRILLTKRDDFEVWCLPGGGVEEAKSMAEAAIWETRRRRASTLSWTRLVGSSPVDRRDVE